MDGVSSELDQRVWGLRSLFVLQSPRTVFSALRSTGSEVANARQEAVSALVLLGGIGAVLAVPQTGRLLDDFLVDNVMVAFLVLLTGFVYGTAGYWIGGALVWIGERSTGGAGGYRRARHLLAFAAAPLALSLLVLWPVRLAVHGDDLFRTGGDDAGSAGTFLARLELLFVLWCVALVVIGLRVVHRWSWARAAVASLPLAAGVAVIVAATGVG